MQRKDLYGPLGLVLLLAALVIFPNLGIPSFFNQMAFLFSIYLILAYAWNLLGGYSGQVSLGNAVFFGLGGYVTALFATSLAGAIEGILIGCVTGALISIVLIPMFRLKGSYFAISTLFMGLAAESLLIQIRIFSHQIVLVYLPLSLLQDFGAFYYLTIGFVAATFALILYLTRRSKAIYAWRAIKADEASAESMGINTVYYKTIALVAMSALTAVAGGLYTLVLGYADPTQLFNLNWSIFPLFIVLVGGVGTIAGPLLGALIFTAADQVLLGFVGTLSLFGFGVLLILVTLFAPRGIADLLARLYRRSISVSASVGTPSNKPLLRTRGQSEDIAS